jgi:hypothetical protein
MTLLRLYRLALVLMTVALVAVSVAYVREHQQSVKRKEEARQTQERLNRAELRASLWRAGFETWTTSVFIYYHRNDPNLKWGRFKIGSVSPSDLPKVRDCLGLNCTLAGVYVIELSPNGDIWAHRKLEVASSQARLIEDADKYGYEVHLQETKIP